MKYQCYAIGADVYAVHQTSDGGHLLAGSGDLKLYDSVPLVPWLAKADAGGNLIWQRFYYRTHPTTGLLRHRLDRESVRRPRRAIRRQDGHRRAGGDV
jgi:hypothetical protein